MRFLLTVLLAAAVSGCGPEQSAREAERNETNALIAEQKAQFDQLEGEYRGTFTNLEGKKVNATLFVHSWLILIPIAGRAENMEVPTLIGNLFSANSAAELNWSFTSGTYFPRNGVLKLIGQNTNGLLSILNVKVSGNKLTGMFSAGKLRSNVEFTKVN